MANDQVASMLEYGTIYAADRHARSHGSGCDQRGGARDRRPFL